MHYQIQDHNLTLKLEESLLILRKRCHRNIRPAENNFKWHRRTDSIMYHFLSRPYAVGSFVPFEIVFCWVYIFYGTVFLELINFLQV